ncbi:MAG: hypothetical protein ACFB4I_02965 [Cyanophyceae cyanobacterium]
MFGLKTVPWLSLLLVFLTFSAFGWSLTESIPDLAEEIVDRASFLGISISAVVVSWTLFPIAATLIIIVAVSLTAPILWIRIGIGNWLKSDFKAFASILLWAFAVAFIFSWIEYFVRLLVLLSVSILARLELQRAGYKKNQASIVLVCCCLFGFAVGVLAYSRWNPSVLFEVG